jgi:hypothetical protein
VKKNAAFVAAMSLLRYSVKELADDWEINRSHLSDILRGAARMGPEIAERFRSNFGLRPQWLIEGTGPIFERGRSPGKKVEQALLRHMELGAPSTGGLPLFDLVDEMEFSDGEGDWYLSARRGTMPVAAAAKKGVYLRVHTRDVARILDCREGDHVLFVPAAVYIRGSRVGEGDTLACLVSAGRRRHVARYEAAQVFGRKETWPTVLRRTESTILYDACDGSRYVLAQQEPHDPLANAKLLGVAVRAERDLIEHALLGRTRGESIDRH